MRSPPPHARTIVELFAMRAVPIVLLTCPCACSLILELPEGTGSPLTLDAGANDDAGGPWVDTDVGGGTVGEESGGRGPTADARDASAGDLLAAGSVSTHGGGSGIGGADGGSGGTPPQAGTTGVDGAGAAAGGAGTTAAAGAQSGGGAGGAAVADAGVPSGSCSDPCDCDDDGYAAEGTCGGDDCDDDDPRVHPEQGAYFPARSDNASVGFDYDCSDAVERDPAQATVIRCNDLDLLSCEDAQGFHDALPPCGEVGAWGTCEWKGVLCSAVVLDSSVVARCH